MRMSVCPVGLPVLAEEVTGDTVEFTLRGRYVSATLMRPHPDFGKQRWWEPMNPDDPSWWSESSDWKRGHNHVVRIEPEGETAEVKAYSSVTDLRLNSSSFPHRKVGTPSLYVTYLPPSQNLPGEYPHSRVGGIMVYTASKLSPAETTGAYISHGVRGAVTLSSATKSLEELTSIARTAVEWAKAPANDETLHRAASAVAKNIAPDTWYAMEKVAGELLSANITASTFNAASQREAALAVMKEAVEEGVRSVDALRDQYTTCRDLIEHFTVDGERIEALIKEITPRWMRRPIDLTVG